MKLIIHANGIHTINGMKQNAICSPTGQSLGSIIDITIMTVVGNEHSSKAFEVAFENQLLSVE
jgi:hypothetical protein